MDIPSFHFEAKKHAYRQTQDGIVVSFVVHPNDVHAALAVASLGTRYMVALAEIGDNGEPVSPGALIVGSAAPLGADDTSASPQKLLVAAPGETKERRRFSELPLPQQVALRCTEEAFQNWVIHQWPLDTAGPSVEEQVAAWVRRRCDVRSRADIKPGSLAAIAWERIETKFRQDTGQMAEAR